MKENRVTFSQYLEPSTNSMSQTVEMSKKKKLTPIRKTFKMESVVKTKAGTNGKQQKINQDIAIV